MNVVEILLGGAIAVGIVFVTSVVWLAAMVTSLLDRIKEEVDPPKFDEIQSYSDVQMEQFCLNMLEIMHGKEDCNTQYRLPWQNALLSKIRKIVEMKTEKNLEDGSTLVVSEKEFQELIKEDKAWDALKGINH